MSDVSAFPTEHLRDARIRLGEEEGSIRSHAASLATTGMGNADDLMMQADDLYAAGACMEAIIEGRERAERERWHRENPHFGIEGGGEP